MIRKSLVAFLLGTSFGCGCDPPASTWTPRDASAADAAATDAGWRVVFDGLAAPLLGVWRSEDGVLFAAGGSRARSLVIRHENGAWWEMEAGTANALWWIHGFSASDVYAVGERGTIAHFNGQYWEVERAGEDFTLWGVFGIAADDVWAVGGSIVPSQSRPVVLRRQGGRWTPFQTGLPGRTSLFKMWGTARDNLYVVGDDGRVARFDGTAFRVEPTPAHDRLVTVFGGGAADIFAVGGLRSPVAIHYDGARWTDYSPIPFSRNLNGGVRVTAGRDRLLLVGWNGYLAESGEAGLVEVPPVVKDCLHAAAHLRDGFVAVGGDLLAGNKRGVLLSSGELKAGPIKPWPFPGRGLPDAGSDDGGSADASSGADSGVADAAVFDAGTPDAASAADGGVPSVDSGAADAGAQDTGIADVGSGPDAAMDGGGPGDAESKDSGETDASSAGADAGFLDAGPGDGGSSDAAPPFPPGAVCDSNLTNCVATEDCWFIVSASKRICTRACQDPTGCSLFGSGACCEIPGPQTHITVCLPKSLGVCPEPAKDGGS